LICGFILKTKSVLLCEIVVFTLILCRFNDGSNAESMGIPFDGVSFSVSSYSSELCVAGPCVCVSSYGSPPNNAQLNTGDVVRITADRAVHFVGRIDRQQK
jgi:hypothetical protein